MSAKTSLSDIPLLHESCVMALKYPEAWASFRCSPGFLFAMENIAPSAYEALIRAVPPTDLTPDLFAGDIGNPPKLKLPDGREISPTFLRYAAISRDLGRRFQMHNANIVEIGCGFGGQCKVLRDHYTAGSIRIPLDTPPMALVAKKYLDHFGIGAQVLGTDELDHLPSPRLMQDLNLLCVSNYALSEMAREAQLGYIQKIIRHCPRGYVTYNNPSKDFDSMDAEEFFSALVSLGKKYVQIAGEYVKTDPAILKITWGID